MDNKNSDLNYTFSKKGKSKKLDPAAKKMFEKIEKYQSLTSGVLGARGRR